MVSKGYVKVITISVIAVTSYLLLRHLPGQYLARDESSRSKSDPERRQKILIILTQTRSGSSFAGEIFAASKNSLYLYEPLYPFGLKCRYEDDKETLLKQLLSCDFSNLDNIYLNGFKKSGWQDGANCRKHGFCFTGASTGLLNSYAKICTNKSQKFEPKSKTCGYPIQPDVLTKLCTSTSLLITKITRICNIEELEKVYRQLVDGERQVYVVHLIRDLRSIASSLIKLSNNEPNYLESVMDDIMNEFCSRQRHNVAYTEAQLAGHVTQKLESNVIADGRYMRVRYEDLVNDPVGNAEKIFRFMGLSLPPEVVSNIYNYLHPNKTTLQQIVKKVVKESAKISRQYRDPFGVVRDPTRILDEWREIVPFDVVQRIQEECGDVLKKNGYVMFPNENYLKNLSLSAF